MTDRSEDLRTLRRFAALSGPFAPKDAFAAVDPGLLGDATRMVDLASALAGVCDTALGAGHWLMRGPERQWELGAIAGGIEDAVDWRRAAPHDAATDDLLDALTGAGPLSDEGVRGLVAAGQPRAWLERAAVALERAGSLAPAYARLDAVRAALTRQQAAERNAALLSPAFLGRETERAAVEAWIATPVRAAPVTALYVRGLPGIGKSTLLEKLASDALAAATPKLVVRLDFDRVGLDVRDWVGLTLELARQLGAQFADGAAELRQQRLRAAGMEGGTRTLKGFSRERVPSELGQAVAAAIQRDGRTLLLFLDTLEVLRGRGETHPGRLFDWIDQLCALGVRPLAVVAAGRGEALDSAASRIGRQIDLGGLDDANAGRLLEGLAAPAESWPAILGLAEGSPLVLRLGATVAREAGAGELARARGRQGLAAAHLYRFLLSRIPEDDLRALAHPGLVVRRISAEVIAEVLAPQLGLGRIAPTRAADLFAALAGQHWLVEPDPQAAGFVKHRADMRGVLLRLLYAASPAKCARIDRAARLWFARRPEPWCAVEAAYHQLQLMRRGAAPAAIDPELLRQFDEEMIAELPPAAQDLVRQGRGERTSLGRVGPMAAGPLPAEAGLELERIVERADWLEGRHFYAQVIAPATVAPETRAADAVRAFLWRTGQWRQARDLLADRDNVAAGDRDVTDLPPHLAAARLEMRAEFAFAALVRTFRADRDIGIVTENKLGRGLKASLGEGALGFVLQRSGIALQTSSWQGFDAISGAFDVWAPQLEIGDAGQALSGAGQLLGSRIGYAPDLDGTPETRARLLAVLSPYARIAATLAIFRSDDRDQTMFHAATVLGRLAGHGALAPAGARDWTFAPSSSSRDAVEDIGSLGLFAEWAGAAAFVLGYEDIRLIARSAERWRRTMAGKWSYGDLPAAWRAGWDRPLDVTLADRVSALDAAADPVDASLRQLAVWAWPAHVGVERFLRRVRSRYRAALARAAPGAGPLQAAAALQAAGMPSAFVPPLAVLADRDRPAAARMSGD